MPLAAKPSPQQQAQQDGYPPLVDYAAIGNCRTVALVSREGSIDWLCLPHFSAPSIFAALLDRRRGGRFAVCPREIEHIERQYLGDSAVLQTAFRCRGGVLRLTDALILLDENDALRELHPQHELVRVAECMEGEVTVDVLFQPRPGYGRRRVGLARRGRLGWQCRDRGMAAYLYGDIELERGAADGSLEAAPLLRQGEHCRLVFSYSENEVAALPPAAEADRQLQLTCQWWHGWAAQCTYRGPYQDAVMRSALTLKLLTYRLSGAVVAAATTSLPEGDSGARNWDYRYCWLRDTSLLLQAFVDLGFREESEAFLGWLLHATRLTQPRLQVIYDIYGETALDERELPYLEGYDGIGPVRIGNAACAQRQLDLYGQVVLTARRFVDHGGQLDDSEKRLMVGFGRAVCRRWRLPDHGIWEIRLPPRHNTHSKLMCWAALDSLVALHRRVNLAIDERAFIDERERIRADIDANGYDAALGSYVGYYGGQAADASLLLMARCGYLPADHPRMVGTARHIERELARDGLLFRYPPGIGYDGVEGEENFFVICSYWLVDYLARLGEVERATALFERLAALANDVGLYAEEFDQHGLHPKGNFPQAFSHVGLITAALALEQAARGKRGEGIRK